MEAKLPPPPIKTIVETSIYCTNLDEMEAFYAGILNLRVVAREAGRHVFLMVGPGSLLLIFNSETTLHAHLFPSHGATGPGHIALGVSAESIGDWREHLIAHAIKIEKEHTWPRGGHSIYFRDPSENSVELITPRSGEPVTDGKHLWRNGKTGKHLFLSTKTTLSTGRDC